MVYELYLSKVVFKMNTKFTQNHTTYYYVVVSFWCYALNWEEVQGMLIVSIC